MLPKANPCHPLQPKLLDRSNQRLSTLDSRVDSSSTFAHLRDGAANCTGYRLLPTANQLSTSLVALALHLVALVLALAHPPVLDLDGMKGEHRNPRNFWSGLGCLLIAGQLQSGGASPQPETRERGHRCVDNGESGDASPHLQGVTPTRRRVGTCRARKEMTARAYPRRVTPMVEGTYGEASPDSPLSTQRWPRSRVSGLTLVVAKLTRQAEVEME